MSVMSEKVATTGAISQNLW